MRRTSVCGSRLIVSLVTSLVAGTIVQAVVVHAENVRVPLPDAAMVRKVKFDGGPGLKTTYFSGRGETDAIMAFLMAHNSDWSQDAKSPKGHFAITIDAGAQRPMVIRAGYVGDAAYLQTDKIRGGSFVRKIKLSDLIRLLELCQCDISVALLRSEEGAFKKRIDGVLAQDTRISSRKTGATGVRRLLSSVISYSRSNPEDKSTLLALRALMTFEVEDFGWGWFVVRLAWYSEHEWVDLLANEDGKAMPATPENCLQVCRPEFLGRLDDMAGVKALCAKVLEGTNHGVIVSENRDIPGYGAKPLPKDKARLIAPMAKSRRDGRTVYKFFAYRRLGGVVWQCTLTVEDKSHALSWTTQEVAIHIGDARYHA